MPADAANAGRRPVDGGAPDSPGQDLGAPAGAALWLQATAGTRTTLAHPRRRVSEPPAGPIRQRIEYSRPHPFEDSCAARKHEPVSPDGAQPNPERANRMRRSVARQITSGSREARWDEPAPAQQRQCLFQLRAARARPGGPSSAASSTISVLSSGSGPVLLAFTRPRRPRRPGVRTSPDEASSPIGDRAAPTAEFSGDGCGVRERSRRTRGSRWRSGRPGEQWCTAVGL